MDDDDDLVLPGQWRRAAYWRQFPTHAEREDHYKLIIGMRKHPMLMVPLTTPVDAMRACAPLLSQGKYKDRALARRGWLAARKGGVCEILRMREYRAHMILPVCTAGAVRDFRYLTLWEFNHITPRSEADGQFVISGNSCGRRKWATVREHCLSDTVLLCRECHRAVTRFDKNSNIFFNQKIQNGELQ